MKRLILLTVSILFLFQSLAFATPGTLTGAYGFNWGDSSETVDRTMTSKGTEQVYFDKQTPDTLTITDIGYVATFAEYKSIAMFRFFENNLCGILFVIPADTLIDAETIYSNLNSLIQYKYGKPNISTGVGLNSKATWNFEVPSLPDFKNSIESSIKDNPAYAQMPIPYKEFGKRYSVFVLYRNGLMSDLAALNLNKIKLKDL